MAARPGARSRSFRACPNYGPTAFTCSGSPPSKHDPNAVYALFDNHKNGDYKPYIFKSVDRGRTWTSIAGDLPANGPRSPSRKIMSIRTCSSPAPSSACSSRVDGGKKWIRLRGNLPTIPVRDLAIQERENDLVLATFGRGFYVLDDYSALRGITADTFDKQAEIFPVKKATIFVPDTGKSRGSQGEQLWMGENPPFRRDVHFLAEGSASNRQTEACRRHQAETTDYPAPAQLTAEADEEPPQVLLTITDAAGKVVKRLTGPTARGLHRVTWNLRGPAASAMAGGRNPFAGDSPEEQNLFAGGPFVLPGSLQGLALQALRRRDDTARH